MKLTTDYILRTSRGKMRPDETPDQFLRKMTHLNVTEKAVTHVEDISVCTNLTVVYLYDNNLTQMMSLEFAINLTHLYLQNNAISRIQGLAACVNLEKLYLSNNRISVVEGLQSQANLRELSVDNQQLPPGEKLIFEPRSLFAISRSLEMLNVSGNGLDTVRELKCLQLVRALNLGHNSLNNMKDVTELISSMPYLVKLEVAGNPLTRKAKYRDRLILANPHIQTLDGREVPEPTKTFLRNWQSAKDRRRREFIHQAMTDGIPDLPPLQRVPPPDRQSGSHRKPPPPPIMRGMKSGSKHVEEIIQRRNQSQNGVRPDEVNDSHGEVNGGHGEVNDSHGEVNGGQHGDGGQGDVYNCINSEMCAHGEDGDMPLLALGGTPQCSSDDILRRQKTDVMDILVRTPEPRCSRLAHQPSAAAGTGSRVVRSQLMTFDSGGGCGGGGGVENQPSQREHSADIRHEVKLQL